MGADHLRAELVADDAERLAQLVTDVVAARALAAEEQREVLGADDRPPWPFERSRVGAGIDADGDLALAVRGGPALDRRR